MVAAALATGGCAPPTPDTATTEIKAPTRTTLAVGGMT